MADIYVQASLYEGYGLTLLEAYKSGLPIVTTNVGLVGSVIPKELVLVFKQKDYNEMTEKIQSALGLQKTERDIEQISFKDYLQKYNDSI